MTSGHPLELDGHAGLRFVRDHPFPRERVWKAVSEPDELKHWFPARVVTGRGGWRPVPGSPVQYVLPPDLDGGSGTVLAVDPPERFALSWGAEEIEVALAAVDDEHTRLTLTVLLEDPATLARTAAGWEVCLDALAARVAGAPPVAMPGPGRPTLAWTRYHDAYLTGS